MFLLLTKLFDAKFSAILVALLVLYEHYSAFKSPPLVIMTRLCTGELPLTTDWAPLPLWSLVTIVME